MTYGHGEIANCTITPVCSVGECCTHLPPPTFVHDSHKSCRDTDEPAAGLLALSLCQPPFYANRLTRDPNGHRISRSVYRFTDTGPSTQQYGWRLHTAARSHSSMWT